MIAPHFSLSFNDNFREVKIRKPYIEHVKYITINMPATILTKMSIIF
jgi:hypothetical protein